MKDSDITKAERRFEMLRLTPWARWTLLAFYSIALVACIGSLFHKCNRINLAGTILLGFLFYGLVKYPRYEIAIRAKFEKRRQFQSLYHEALESKDSADRLTAEITKMLVDSLAPKQVILFGNWGRGEQNADDRIDLLIVLDGKEPPTKTNRVLQMALRDTVVPLNINLYHSEDEEWYDNRPGYITDAFREGKPLYERAV